MSTDPQIATPWAELQRRIVYTLLRPAMRICRLFRMPLSTVEELVRMAYFEEIRLLGASSQAQTALLMGRSLRTIGTLERQYRSDFLAPEAELETMREVEEAFDEGPLTLDEVKERLPHVEGEGIERIVESLWGMGRLKREPNGADDRFVLDRTFVSLVRDDADAQLDGLRHQLDVIVSAVNTRFFAADRPAVARTLAFVADPAEMETLGDSFILDLRRKCIEAEESAIKNKVYERFAVTFALTPMERS